MTSKTYNAKLWGAVAITAGITALVVGAAVFFVMQVKINKLEKQNLQVPAGMGFVTNNNEDGTLTTTIPVEGGTAITYPDIYSLQQTDEVARPGAFETLGFTLNVQTLVAATQLSELAFFNADSVAGAPNSADVTPESFFQDFRSVDSGTNGANGELMQFNGVNWIVRDEPLADDIGQLRRYASFINNTRVELTLWLPDISKIAEADALFEQVIVAKP